MRDLLARDNAELLAQLAWSRVLLAFDYDGTLAPIVAERDAARMRGGTATLLAALCQRYPCAVISGRGRVDVAARLDRARVRYVVGNHGLEPGGGLRGFARQIARARPLLASALADCAGVDIEDKRYSLAIHYRRSRQKRQARPAILRAVEALPVDMRVVLGKLVVNAVPAGAPSKADALLRLRAAARADTALYVGDDITDEDVFQLDQPGRLVTVRIGASRSSAARYYLRSQRDIDRLLARLVELRRDGLRR